ncbi:MAG: RNA methyltransferase [Calothrix sp. SM1_5_4]|nr:RNA methyltransferase [Calothrix sp. SM1_5_4]
MNAAFRQGPEEISSPQNPKFKCWLSLLEAKGIKKEKLALVSGTKIVDELLRHSPDGVRALLLPPKADPPPAIHGKIYRLSAPLFRDLDVMGTKATLAVIDRPEIEEWRHEAPSGLELIVALSDPGNLGALLRSAEAFGVRRVILTAECSSPFLPRAIRASSGSVFRMRMAQTGALQSIKPTQAFSLDMDGEDISRMAWPKDLYLVLGEEGRGVPAELKTRRLRIPMEPMIESLNATVAASIALFSYRNTIKAGTPR